MASSGFLVDSNVILDILTEDERWLSWSASTLSRCAERGLLYINPVIYAEISMGFERVEDLEASLHKDYFRYAHLPYEAAFLAGKCFLRYRRAGGKRRSPLPDFFIGAHAAVKGLVLVTRDMGRYRTYFPGLEVICPQGGRSVDGET